MHADSSVPAAGGDPAWGSLDSVAARAHGLSPMTWSGAAPPDSRPHPAPQCAPLGLEGPFPGPTGHGGPRTALCKQHRGGHGGNLHPDAWHWGRAAWGCSRVQRPLLEPQFPPGAELGRQGSRRGHRARGQPEGGRRRHSEYRGLPGTDPSAHLPGSAATSAPPKSAAARTFPEPGSPGLAGRRP